MYCSPFALEEKKTNVTFEELAPVEVGSLRTKRCGESSTEELSAEDVAYHDKALANYASRSGPTLLPLITIQCVRLSRW
jgi:hypothetical protein